MTFIGAPSALIAIPNFIQFIFISLFLFLTASSVAKKPCAGVRNKLLLNHLSRNLLYVRSIVVMLFVVSTRGGDGLHTVRLLVSTE